MRYPLIVLLAAAASCAFSELRVGKDAQSQLSYGLNPKPFLSPKVKRDLTSGISTQLALLAELKDSGSHVVDRQLTLFSIKYDLWEEKFEIVRSGGEKISLNRQPEVEALMEGPGPISWLPVEKLTQSTTYRIHVIETVNPISRQRLEEVQKWVTSQRLSVRNSISLNGGTLPSIPDGPFNALFQSLWQRTSEGEVLAGEMRRELESEPFKAGELRPLEKAP